MRGGWALVGQVAVIVFVVTLVAGVWTGAGGGLGVVNGLALLVALVAGGVLLYRRVRR